MRLRTALEASALVDEPILCWLDRPRERWILERDLSVVGQAAPIATSDGSSAVARLKRSVFPSTLYESGRMPARALHAEQIPQASTIVLHTSYLAPLAGRVRAAGVQRVVTDVHDLVYGAHADDASYGPATVRALRHTYARTVRYRERQALSQADVLAVAGWGDTLRLKTLAGPPVVWAPVGIASTTAASPATREIRVGMIGNFAHSATIGAANALLESPLGMSEECRLVFAGLHSETWRTRARTRAEVLGPVENIRTFYDSVHAVVVPVQNASGMKCKLAEGILARKAVVTTPQGASGYPPSLNRHFTIAKLESLTPDVVRSSLLRDGGDDAYLSFEAACGRSQAANSYATVFNAAR